MDDNLLTFAAESLTTERQGPGPSWKVMIIDDEKSIHDITSLSLREFTYDGRGISFINAYSAQEARQCLKKHPDTALMLVDVVMESEDAGLKLVQYVRNDLKNDMVQVVIRTGQPGYAPEDQVIAQYRINSYFSKTEVTSQKLVNLVTTSLRTYQLALALKQELKRRKLAEQKLLRLNQDLEDKIQERTRQLFLANQMKSQFLANMSHEIRTPMNGIMAMAGILMEEDLTPKQAEYAAIIHSSANTLLTLINDILDLSKIEAGRLQFEIRPFSIRRIVKESLDMFRLAAMEKGLELVWAVDDSLPQVLDGDEVRVKQILVNLVGNAVKFTETGQVTVAADWAEQGKDQVRLGLEVRDTGPGIEASFMAMLFEKFSQQDASTTRKYGGTGLGLAITRQLAQLMDGSIRAWNNQGGGAAFRVELVLAKSLGKDGESGDKALEDQKILALNQRIKAMDLRVLVAEDNPVNQKVIRMLLERMNLVPDLVENGRQALERLGSDHYHVLIMDVHMPQLDGLQTAREIRDPANGLACRQIPIIALTALAMAEDAQACVDAGMDFVLTKPVHPRKLVLALARVLGL